MIFIDYQKNLLLEVQNPNAPCELGVLFSKSSLKRPFFFGVDLPLLHVSERLDTFCDVV
jgi:hypothetical protein